MINIIKTKFFQNLFKNINGNTRKKQAKSGRKFRSTSRFILTTLLTFAITITWVPAALSQIPFFPTIETPENNQLVFEWFNRPYKCGNLMCSKVWFNGQHILTLATPPREAENQDSTIKTVEQRAKTVEINLQQVLKPITQVKTNVNQEFKPENQQRETIETGQSQSQNISTLRPNLNQLKTITKKLTPEDLNNVNSQVNAQNLNFHPKTPKIEIGTLNNLTVLFVPQQPGIRQQTLLTVTKYDVIANFANDERELAKIWQTRIQKQFSQFLKQQEYYTQKPWVIPLQISLIILAAILFSWGLQWIHKRLKTKIQNLRKQLKELDEALKINPEEISGENLKSTSESNQANQPQTSVKTNKRAVINNQLKTVSPTMFMAMVENAPLAFATQLENIWQTLPKVFLKEQFILKQQKNIAVLVWQLLLWVQVFIWVGGISLILAIFPETRALFWFILSQYVQILLIWVVASVIDKASHFMIDFSLNKWATEAQLSSTMPERYTKRVNTYSNAIIQATSFLIYIIAIFLTVQALGFSLAGAGIIGVVATYVFKPKVDHVINGCLILWTDQYAVGDIIQIGDVAGFVEHMNLYLTQLRGAEGRLITVPNGSFEVVQNLTKEWSRVDFLVEIAYSADARRALEVIREVSEQMRSEPEWQDKILEPASILGVDNISHRGLLIQVWIKTGPIQQFAVGREFRLRIKQAFEQEDIAIGMPQQSLAFQNYPTNGNGNIDDPGEKPLSSFPNEN
ncbi:MAG: mechanosensitive ion channel family protein [Microcoleaceae cyanobacterium MO_207.B10]|nr:mechanosensitive ion channel family protein [Microcoleaceae cyanobacterium MO_207.B10]